MTIAFLEDPIEQFLLWYSDAVRKKVQDPAAMTLATVNLNGMPSARTVLYKGISKGGFLIFTNFHSRKAKDLFVNPYAAWVFYWPKIYKQIRGEGYVQKLTREESEAYFETRPYENKISAWVSEQSQEIPSREYLLNLHKKYQKKFPEEVPCPEFWGGFRLVPIRIEFWIGRQFRLHDRFCYFKQDDEWRIIRLSP